MPNHTVPSAATAIPDSPDHSPGTANSENLPSPNFPILLPRNSTNHALPDASTAISLGELPAVGISYSVICSPGAILTSVLPPCKVPHTTPFASTATPYGPPRADFGTLRVNSPSLSRVNPYALLSANHTAPSGATASRPSRAIGVFSGKDLISPLGSMREICTSVGSTNHAAPCASTARPTGSTFFLLLGRRCTLPSWIIPTASAKPIVNHTVSSGPAATAVGISLATVIAYSTNSPPGLARENIVAAMTAMTALTINISLLRENTLLIECVPSTSTGGGAGVAVTAQEPPRGQSANNEQR